ncbi:MAG: Ppx/GppA phosphatase family protein [Sphingomonadaceae bacterium]|nr:Ppx/GppA phosphatase family protein [Sphingomonadaceae bacterium]
MTATAGALAAPPTGALPLPAYHPDPRMRRRTYAALDLGTNNCRLLIARPARDGFFVVDSFSRVVRLGEGLLASGRISDAAQDRALEALKICAGKLRRREVTLARSVATEACRRAANGPKFIERVYGETGIALDVITAAEEARLAVLGCQTLIDPARGRALVFDIGGGGGPPPAGGGRARGGAPAPRAGGGGVVLFRAGGPPALVGPAPRSGGGTDLLHWTSVPWGVISLAETEPGPLTTEAERLTAYQRMHGRMTQGLARFREQILNGDGPQQLLGTSGTVTTLAALYLDLPSYDRRQVDGCDVPSDAMRALGLRLAGYAPSERAALPTIGPDRADLIVAGCAILESILAAFPGLPLRIADRGIREGILRTLIARDAAP